MTRLVNAAANFAHEALEGFATANRDVVAAVPGGIVRASASAHGEVAVIMGGGSGHYPAFAGWVGPGLGHGAACGDIFSSPSEEQILTVARAANNGGGIMFVPINYAGDILNFSGAAEALRADGIDVRMVAVTDDIASGTNVERHTRRGIAGSLLVLKMVGAAAARGLSLDEVERVTSKANEATRSLGVALTGCTVPGHASPLFTVPVGRIAVGLGIHGEPGISEADLGSADEIADLIIDGLFNERRPVSGARIGVLVNGLGSTKYDELHLVFRRARTRLEGVGMRLVEPVVGEQVTSLDMAGVSISLTHLDDELEALWLDPASTVAFSRGGAVLGQRRETKVARRQQRIAAGSLASQGAAVAILNGLVSTVATLSSHEARLGEIDAIAGDGDHGAGMLRGARAGLAKAHEAVDSGAGAGTTLSLAGGAWSAVGGGTSGALWGTALKAAGTILGDVKAPNMATITEAVRAFATAIIGKGGAAEGDKTMIDAILPFSRALEREAAAGRPLDVAWARAAGAAMVAAQSTALVVSKRGRSRIHGERSLGTPDPGALSFAIIVSALSEGM